MRSLQNLERSVPMPHQHYNILMGAQAKCAVSVRVENLEERELDAEEFLGILSEIGDQRAHIASQSR
jgi:hypothetical protein